MGNYDVRPAECAYDTDAAPLDKGFSVKDALQEANKILREISTVLTDLENNVTGKGTNTDTPKTPECLADEARFVTGMAYDCLQRVNRIKEALL